MAKVSFTKLGLSKPDDMFYTYKYNDQEIEIKRYLPIKEKLELMTNVINKALDSSGKYYNPAQLEVLLDMEIIYTYTNISFTEKQKEDYCKCYDMLRNSDILTFIKDTIPEEVEILALWIRECLHHIYAYNNSFMGILENSQHNFDNLNLDASEIQSKLADPENLSFLKEIAPLLNLA